ncbi:MAG: lysylphosphatidylglycerol synthase transmembrane domain-containing protein [Planctomycetia bacterium]
MTAPPEDVPGLTVGEAEAPKKRNLLWDLARLAVTVGMVCYVVAQIQWKDRLVAPGAEPEVGWLVYEGKSRFLATDDGRRLPLPAADAPPPKAEPGASAGPQFVPGFFTLFRGINFPLFLFAVVLFPFQVVLLGWRWRLLLKSHDLDPGLYQAIRLTWIGLIANNVLPGSTGGDFIKGLCIYRRSPGKRVAAVMTVLMDRALGLVALMTVGGTALLAGGYRPALRGPAIFLGTVLTGLVVVGTLFFSRRVRRWLRVSELFNRLPGGQKLRLLDDSVFHYRHHKLLLAKCMAISFMLHGWTMTCVWLLSISLLGPVIALPNFFIFLPIIYTAGAVVPSIGGLGVMEGLFQRFFSLPGVGGTPSGAVALCILFRMMSLLGSLPGAWPAYYEFSRQAGLKKTGEAPPTEPVSTQPTA